ncbi:MAG: DUF1499 domain-containing protein [Chloroflexota bacterium]
MKIALYVLIAILILAVALRLLIPFMSPEPDNLGVQEGKLASCPDTPNCVSSFAAGGDAAIDPIEFTGSAGEAKASLLNVLDEMPRSTIRTNEPNYVRVVTRSPIMGYLDDNEFLIDEESGVIHVRAAARLGRSDLGANRMRIEQIRQLMQP